MPFVTRPGCPTCGKPVRVHFECHPGADVPSLYPSVRNTLSSILRDPKPTSNATCTSGSADSQQQQQPSCKLILLTHGFGSGSSLWDQQVPALVQRGFTVITWDMRGHAKSDSPTKRCCYSKQHQVDDMCAVLDAATQRKPNESPATAIFCGHSMGGYDNLLMYDCVLTCLETVQCVSTTGTTADSHTATQLPIKQGCLSRPLHSRMHSLMFCCFCFHRYFACPERFAGLVLYATGPGFKSTKSLASWNKVAEKMASGYEKKGLEALRGSDKRKGHRSAVGLALSCRYVFGQHDDDPLFQHFSKQGKEGVLTAAHRLGEVTIPVSILVGKRDKAFLGASKMMQAKIPGASLRVISNGGHMVCEKNPAEFNKVRVANGTGRAGPCLVLGCGLLH